MATVFALCVLACLFKYILCQSAPIRFAKVLLCKCLTEDCVAPAIVDCTERMRIVSRGECCANLIYSAYLCCSQNRYPSAIHFIYWR